MNLSNEFLFSISFLQKILAIVSDIKNYIANYLNESGIVMPDELFLRLNVITFVKKSFFSFNKVYHMIYMFEICLSCQLQCSTRSS